MNKSLALFIDRFRSYGLVGTIRLSRDIICTRLFFPRARIVRWPFYIRNRGQIRIGRNFTTGVGLRIDCLQKSSRLTIGDNVQINDYCHIGVKGNVVIGNNTLIASKVMIMDHNHGNIRNANEASHPSIPPVERPLENADITISENAWIGECVQILPGVSIGAGSIIGTGSVVTKNVEPNCIAVGNPARIIKKFDLETNLWLSLSNKDNPLIAASRDEKVKAHLTTSSLS